MNCNKLSRPFSFCHEWISWRELICITHYSHFHFRKWPISKDAVRVWRTERGPKPRGKADVTVPMEAQTSNYCGASGKLIPAGSFVCWCKSKQSFRSFPKTGKKSLLIKRSCPCCFIYRLKFECVLECAAAAEDASLSNGRFLCLQRVKQLNPSMKKGLSLPIKALHVFFWHHINTHVLRIQLVVKLCMVAQTRRLSRC